MFAFETNVYSVDIAKRFGLHTAVLLSYIDREYSHFMRMGELTSTGMFIVNRYDIVDRTGETLEEISKVEEILKKLGILEVSTPSRQTEPQKVHYKYFPEKVSLTIVQSSMADPFKELVANTKSEVSKVAKVTRKEKELASLKSSIVDDDESIKQYWCDWLDSVYHRNLSLTKAAFEITQSELSNFSKEDKEEILRIAIKTGYKDISIAVDTFNKSRISHNPHNWKSYEDMQSTNKTEISSEAF